MKINTSRRDILKSMVKFSGVIAGSAVLLPFISCKGSSAKSGTDTVSAKTDDNPSCEPQELSQQEHSVRQSLNYVDASPLGHRNCANCKVYTLPKPNSLCGGCKIVPGPIHPKGYCTAWIARM